MRKREPIVLGKINTNIAISEGVPAHNLKRKYMQFLLNAMKLINFDENGDFLWILLTLCEY